MSAARGLPVARAAVRLGALAIAWLGTLEALAGVALEVKLKGMYLGPGAEWPAVLTRLVDVTVIPKSVAAHALAGALAALVLGGVVDAIDRVARRAGAREPARAAARPGARAFGVLAGALVAGAVEYGLIRRGFTGALWPLDTIGAADLAALVPLGASAWLASRAGTRAAAAWLASRSGARVLRFAERAGWAGLGIVCAASMAVTAVGKPAATSGRASGGASATSRPPDVVMVVLDTARADRFSTFGAARPTSPNLTGLAARGTLYTQAMSTAPWTLPSHGTLFTGELPHRHGADWGWMGLRPEVRTLAEVFRDAGYRTAAFTNNPWIGPVAGLDRGFDELHPMWRRHGGTWDRLLLVRAARRATGADPDEGAAETIAELDRWLGDASGAARPVFLFVNLMELHDPNWPERGSSRWLPPGTTRARLRGLNQNPYRWFARRVTMDDADFSLLADLYDAQVSYLDERVAELVRVLDARRGLADVVLAIVGDHGENLGDHGLLSHVFSLHQSLVHVPLLVVAPGRVPAGQVVEAPVSLVDVAPTLEGLAGVGAAGAPGRRGRSLIDEPPAGRAERVLIAEHPPPGPILDILRSNDANLDLAPFDRSWLAARDGDWKLIVNGDGATALHDLGADPGETRDVSAEHPDVVARLRQALAEPLARIPASRASAAAPGGQALDPETIARLHALGYM